MYSGTGFVVEKGQASSLVPYLPDLVAAAASAVPLTAAFDSTCHRLLTADLMMMMMTMMTMMMMCLADCLKLASGMRTPSSFLSWLHSVKDGWTPVCRGY
jgi:hypothetical protein